MSEERRKVLEMLADGQINADEAERLLRAVNEGEGAIASAKATIAKLGDAVSEAIGDAVGSVEERLQTGKPIENAGEGFDMGAGSQLNVRVRGSNVTVTQGPEGSPARVVSSNNRDVKVTQDGDACHVRVGRHAGNVDISIPPIKEVSVKVMGGETKLRGITAARTHVTVQGGNLHVTDCDTALSSKCMGGNVVVTGRISELDLKIMGGSVSVDGLAVSTGVHRVKVMGGRVALTASDEASVLVRTNVFGGTVSSDLPVEGETKASGGQMSATYRIGGGDATLDIKVFGGKVKLTGPVAEPVAAPGEHGGE